jgi:N-succinyldiaminopimelate aminotransferase
MLRVENAREVSKALMEEGIYVTSMDGWGGAHGDSFVRFVFSSEPCHRLKGIGRKARAAIERYKGGSGA